MNRSRLSLGLDLSTQSISAVVLDTDSMTKVFEHSLDYFTDNRLNKYGIRRQDYILPPTSEGEASQPPVMFFAAIDAILSDIAEAIDPVEIAVINSSGQQHGHVYLNAEVYSVFSKLTGEGVADSELANLLKGSLAWDRAPTWMTANTAEQADFIRKHAGGKERVIVLSGSNMPLRFTGAVIRAVAQRHPDIYYQTSRIHLISSLIPAVLTGNSAVPADFGNACGTSLMDYIRKQWADTLIKATADGLPGGEKALRDKLPKITAPDATAGRIARYFVGKYGFSPACIVLNGSGDNPQSKVPVAGDLLSLGTSFVNMVTTDGNTYDMDGYANAMYDGLGRPFMFGCRTNGAMVWDRLRAMYGMAKEEYDRAEQALRQAPIASSMVFWQPVNESFPLSRSYNIYRAENNEPDFNSDYAGLVETSLAAVYYHSKGFTRTTTEPLYVTGGATGSTEIMRRVAAIWNRPIIPVGKGGAATGAAIAGIRTIFRSAGEIPQVYQSVGEKILRREKPVQPRPDDVQAFHSPGGYLERFAIEEAKLL